MKLNAKQIQGLIRLIGLTRERELNCNECLDHVAEFAECELRNKPIPHALNAVKHHLEICDECREEYEELREALSELSECGEDSLE